MAYSLEKQSNYSTLCVLYVLNGSDDDKERG